VKRATMILALMGAVAPHAPALAQTKQSDMQGAALLASCRAAEQRCGAYLQGVLDMMIVARKAECGAPRDDRAALRAAYLRWAERDSYFQSVHMVAGAEQALSSAWPCPGHAAERPTADRAPAH
jgi:hypothetical protein